VRICCISDAHGNLPSVPDVNLLLLGGDYCRDHRDRRWYLTSFCDWLQAIRDRGIAIVGVAGNHDRLFEVNKGFATVLPWTYLQDEETRVGDLWVYGSPWQPRFFDWSFNLDEPELKEKWDEVPEGIDILLLHGPPQGYGDLTPSGHVGSPSLLDCILEVKPKLVVAGHIHGGYGVYDIGGHTKFVNASHCDEQYRPMNPPIVVEL
jgi:Icc-related predicted phosphoesterase